jgi:hypothetical protein
VNRWVPRLPYATGASDATARLMGAQVITVLGDSHARVFSEVRQRHLTPGTRFDVVTVAGATARGLANPNSKTNAVRRYRAALRTVPRSRKCVVMLGEVDCGFLVWYRSAAHATPVEYELERSVNAHTRFLDEMLVSGRRRLCVVSAPLPTADDYPMWSGLTNERRAVRAGIRERTDATIAYNGQLRDWADSNGCAFLDLDLATLDRSTGIIRDRFRNPSEREHHLHPELMAGLVAEEMSRLMWPDA